MRRIVCLICLTTVTALCLPALAGAVTPPQPPAPFPPEPAPDIETSLAAACKVGRGSADLMQATIEHYFRLREESLARRKGLDLALVIDIRDPRGRDLYNYELGKLQYVLLCWEHTRSGVVATQHELEVETIRFVRGEARVSLTVTGNRVYRQSQEGVPFAEHHLLILVESDNRWLIVSDQYCDEGTEMYPRGTDFAALASTFDERVAAWEAEQVGLSRCPDPADSISLLAGTYRYYNGYYAANYALAHTVEGDGGYTTTNYNYPAFQHFIPNDCANFVSQAVWSDFGGTNPGIPSHASPMTFNWWCDSSTGSTNWVNVGSFINMATANRSYDLVGVQGAHIPMGELRVGDIIRQADYGHIMIMTGWSDKDSDGRVDYNEIRFSAHTYNHRDIYLSDTMSYADPTTVRFFEIWRFRIS